MWPFEEISDLFYRLVHRKQFFRLRIEGKGRFDEFHGYAPDNYNVEEWASLIHRKLGQYDLAPTYQHIGDMHIALSIWAMTTENKEKIEKDPIPEETLSFSPVLGRSLQHIETTKAPRQIPN